jgi:branched-subunit amino acid aminotransferase/4-amino-4-deoxychorismate lyase
MFSLVWHNGAIMALDEARVSPASAGALYGWGVFTTLRVAGGEPRAFDSHWRRLSAHAARAGVPLEWRKEDVERGLVELIARCGAGDARARVTALRGAAGPWRAPGACASDVTILLAPRPARPDGPFGLTISPYRLSTSSPIAGIKATAFVGYLMALEEARGRGYDEALLLDERGEVVEACTANVFWVRDGELYTPSLLTSCLAGVTRALVLEAAARRRIRVVEGSFGLAAVREADEVFLTNSGWGVVPVSDLDARRFGGAPLARVLSADVEALLGGSPRT